MFHLFPSNNSDAAKRGTDLPRFPHLISNHKLIVRFYSCVFYFTLNFIIASFFYIFFSSFNKLIHWKKVSFHVLFCAQKIHLHLIRVSNYAPSACSTLIRFTRGSQSTSTVFFFTLFSLKDMNVCVIHGFPLTNHWFFFCFGVYF